MVALEPINIVGVFIALVLFYQSSSLIRMNNESLSEFILLVCSGGFVLVYSLTEAVTVPTTLKRLNLAFKSLGFEGGIDGLFAVTTLLLLLAMFYVRMEARENNMKIHDMYREIAYLRYELEQKHSSRESQPNEDSDD